MTAEETEQVQEEMLADEGTAPEATEEVGPEGRIGPTGSVLVMGAGIAGMQASLDMTSAYVKKRMTYGRSVGSYQVVQHYLANIWMDVETSRNITYLAAWKINEGLPCGKEVGAAKAWVGKAFTHTTERCIQMHGAIGLTREHDIGLYYRSAKAWDLAFGDGTYQKSIIAKEMNF